MAVVNQFDTEQLGTARVRSARRAIYVEVEFRPVRHLRSTWRTVGESFRSRFPRLMAMLAEAEDDVLAYADFPPAHWHQVWSNNPLEMASSQLIIAA